MRAIFSERLRSSYENAPPHIQRAFDRRIALLLQNLTSDTRPSERRSTMKLAVSGRPE